MKVQGTLMWFKNEISDLSGKYEVNITNLSDEDTAKLKDAGVNVRNEVDPAENQEKKKGWGSFIVSRSNYKTKMVTASLEGKVPEDIRLGNGTLVNAVLNVWQYNHPVGGQGTSTSCQVLQILRLEQYDGTGELAAEAGHEFSEAESEEGLEELSDETEATTSVAVEAEEDPLDDDIAL